MSIDASSTQAPESLMARSLRDQPGLAHGFFTRRGGISRGIYASLNCGPGSDDDPEQVAQNRARVTAALGAEDLVTLYQVHSANALVVDAPWPPNTPRPRADAVVTATRGLAVGALSADCTPVLFADPDARIVAAAHSGWRGAVGGILEATIDAMVNQGASRSTIIAAIGPCINQDAYEVGHDFKSEIVEITPGYASFFSQSAVQDKPHFDLPGFVAAKLENAGLRHIESLARCTWTHSEQFFSYRRTQQKSDADYGRQISAIVLT